MSADPSLPGERGSAFGNQLNALSNRVEYYGIEHKLKLRGLQNRKVDGFDTIQNLADVVADLSVHLEKTGPIAHKPSSFGILA